MFVVPPYASPLKYLKGNSSQEAPFRRHLKLHPGLLDEFEACTEGLASTDPIGFRSSKEEETQANDQERWFRTDQIMSPPWFRVRMRLSLLPKLAFKHEGHAQKPEPRTLAHQDARLRDPSF